MSDTVTWKLQNNSKYSSVLPFFRTSEYSGSRLKRLPYNEKSPYIKHKQIVSDSFVTLVEQNYSPITKPDRKTST